MSRHISTVQSIRRILKENTKPARVDVEQLANEYALVCESASRRRARCEAFLKRGLRTEAVALAEVEPKLLETIAALDFPELAAWIELTQGMQLVRPTDLGKDAAVQLGEALKREVRFRDLLREHRRLALARAPLPYRIAVLRQLAKHDSKNPVWTEGLKSLEEPRLMEIRRDAQAAYDGHDLRTLDTLIAELTGRGWVTPPPITTTGRIQRAGASLRRQFATSALPNLESALYAAYEAQDVARGRQLRQALDQAVADSGLGLDDPLHLLVEPALQWLRERDRHDQESSVYQKVVHQFEAALGNGGTVEELTDAYHALHNHPWGVPAHLDKRYRERLELAAKEKKRWWRQ